MHSNAHIFLLPSDSWYVLGVRHIHSGNYSKVVRYVLQFTAQHVGQDLTDCQIWEDVRVEVWGKCSLFICDPKSTNAYLWMFHANTNCFATKTSLQNENNKTCFAEVGVLFTQQWRCTDLFSIFETTIWIIKMADKVHFQDTFHLCCCSF